MAKSITLKISYHPEFCTVEATCQEFDVQSASFTLAPCKDSLEKFAIWTKSLKEYIPIRRGAIAYRRTRDTLNRSEQEFYEQCERSKQDLFISFNQLLNDESLQNWLRDILSQTMEPVRVIIQTDSLEIAALPWEQWSFWDSYYSNNDLVIALSFLNPALINKRLDTFINSFSSLTRILVVLGEASHNKNKIDLNIDYEEFQKFKQDLNKLGDRANLDIQVHHPNRSELEKLLQEDWHIIYYGGHSQTLETEKDGVLYLREGSQVKISELENIFQNSLAQSVLRLLIVNACQGLGTAFRLVSIGLPNIIVMRESIPDDFAHDFLRYLLESFMIGLPISGTTQHCKPHLRDAYDLRHQLPGASLLPVLCLTSESLQVIDQPIIPFDELHPICQEMRALANLAKARLTLTDTNNIQALRVQKYYADLLHHKNKVFYEDSQTEVSLEQLSCSPPRILGKRIWEIDFIVTVYGQDFVWGQGYVNIKTGNSELLLDVRPWSWTGTLFLFRGEGIKQFSLSEEAKLEIDGQIQKWSFTKFALLNLEKEYEKYTSDCQGFDGIKQVSNFGGWLKDVNKKKFLKNLVILRHQGLIEEIAKQQAYAKTPFGKARCELGITEVTIIFPQKTHTSVIEVMNKDDWTEKDQEDLRKAGIREALWTTIKVPQYIIVSTAKRPSIKKGEDCPPHPKI